MPMKVVIGLKSSLANLTLKKNMDEAHKLSFKQTISQDRVRFSVEEELTICLEQNTNYDDALRKRKIIAMFSCYYEMVLLFFTGIFLSNC